MARMEWVSLSHDYYRVLGHSYARKNAEERDPHPRHGCYLAAVLRHRRIVLVACF